MGTFQQTKEIVTATAKAVKRGWKGEFLSLEQALTHPHAERKLIDLYDSKVYYDRENKTVHYLHGGLECATMIPPEFHDYMDRYEHNIRYITDAGTPWQTRVEEAAQTPEYQQQRADYIEALKAGMNTDVAIIHWRSTNARRKDTGHTAISVGQLILAKGSHQSDQVPIYEYDREISGSFYPASTPALRPGSGMVKPLLKREGAPFHLHYKAATERFGDHPVAHTLGVVAHDMALPVGVGSATVLGAIVGDQIMQMIKKEPRPAEVHHLIRAMSLGILAYSAGKATGALKTHTGVVLLKEEQKGSGMLATLITRPQLDIMEHSLYGMYKTYHSEYNLIRKTKKNCADFADKMLEEIGIQTASLLQEIMPEAEPSKPKKFASRVVDKVRDATIPYAKRPDRMSHAMRLRDKSTDIRGEFELDGETLHASLLGISGQSSVLIDMPDTTDRFGDRPIETFEKVMREVLTLRFSNKHQHYHFTFQPHVKRIDVPSPEAGHNR